MPVITFPAVPWPKYFTCQRQSPIIGFLGKIKPILAYTFTYQLHLKKTWNHTCVVIIKRKH